MKWYCSARSTKFIPKLKYRIIKPRVWRGSVKFTRLDKGVYSDICISVETIGGGTGDDEDVSGGDDEIAVEPTPPLAVLPQPLLPTFTHQPPTEEGETEENLLVLEPVILH